jgi:hypothetical protein
MHQCLGVGKWSRSSPRTNVVSSAGNSEASNLEIEPSLLLAVVKRRCKSHDVGWIQYNSCIYALHAQDAKQTVNQSRSNWGRHCAPQQQNSDKKQSSQR